MAFCSFCKNAPTLSASLQRRDCIESSVFCHCKNAKIIKKKQQIIINALWNYSRSVLVHYSSFSVLLDYILFNACVKISITLKHHLSIYTQNQSRNFMSWNKQFRYKNICKFKISTVTCWNNLNPPGTSNSGFFSPKLM